MDGLRKLVLCVAVLLLAASNSGCKLLHELQPHRLHRLNRGTGMESGYEAYFSVSDLVRRESASENSEEAGAAAGFVQTARSAARP